MKYIKLFENLEEPQVGDFVVCQIKNIRSNYDTKQNEKIKDDVGKIQEIINRSFGEKFYRVHYKNIFKGSAIFSREDIIVYAKTIEELELKMNANKYNL